MNAPTTPSTATIIPARGGSKGVPGKNLARIGGTPLIVRAIESCRAAGIETIAVSTDSADIASVALTAGATVIERPPQLATDTASSESALLHGLDELEAHGVTPDVLVFVQCTSPFIDPGAIREGIAQVARGDADCVFSAVKTYEFLWIRSDDGDAKGVNHDPSVRPRRQDREPHWRETGAFYVLSVPGFRAARHRFFGRVQVVEVDAADSLEIDTRQELELAQVVADRRRSAAAADFSKIRLLVTDFDGVHTDDKATVDEDGKERVTVSRRDGQGIKMLRKAGIEVVILSTEVNSVVARRAEKLGIECIHGVDDKWAVLRKWLDQLEIAPANTAYIGNDVNDVDCMRSVAIACAPADAHPSARLAAHIVTTAAGGNGTVREVADLILSAQGMLG